MAAASLLTVWPQMLGTYKTRALPCWQTLFFDHAGHITSAGESRPWYHLTTPTRTCQERC